MVTADHWVGSCVRICVTGSSREIRPSWTNCMTKIFTAAAVMQLVQEGRISLDEPVTQILTQLPTQWSAVTIRHCLSHTSGLPDVLTDDVNGTTVSGDRDTALADVAKQPLKPPGTASVYNQTGYILLGMIM